MKRASTKGNRSFEKLFWIIFGNKLDFLDAGEEPEGRPTGAPTETPPVEPVLELADLVIADPISAIRPLLIFPPVLSLFL